LIGRVFVAHERGCSECDQLLSLPLDCELVETFQGVQNVIDLAYHYTMNNTLMRACEFSTIPSSQVLAADACMNVSLVEISRWLLLPERPLACGVIRPTSCPETSGRLAVSRPRTSILDSGESRRGTNIRWAARPLSVQVRPPRINPPHAGAGRQRRSSSWYRAAYCKGQRRVIGQLMCLVRLGRFARL
jgi:hypothetical protein